MGRSGRAVRAFARRWTTARHALATLFALATIVSSGAFPHDAHAADAVFSHRGWEAFVVKDEPMGGCRMARPVGELHAVVHVTERGQFLIGFVDHSVKLAPNELFTGHAIIDGRFFPLDGSADNPQLVTFGSDDAQDLERAFRRGRRLRMEWSNGTGWIDMSLEGTDHAVGLLRRCAAAFAPAPQAPPALSYAPRAPTGSLLMADTDLYGNDYRRLDGIAAGQCIAICAADDRCTAVTHNGSNAVCFMKSMVGRSASFLGATSWIK